MSTEARKNTHSNNSKFEVRTQVLGSSFEVAAAETGATREVPLKSSAESVFHSLHPNKKEQINTLHLKFHPWKHMIRTPQ